MAFVIINDKAALPLSGASSCFTKELKPCLRDIIKDQAICLTITPCHTGEGGLGSPSHGPPQVLAPEHSDDLI